MWDQPKLEISGSDGFAKALGNEYQGLGETIKSYVVFAIAISTLLYFQSEFGFFFILLIFAIFFVSTAHVKAYLAVLKSTPRGNANRTLLSIVSLVNEFPLVFVTILLVQVVMNRVTPFFSDGHFGWDSLVLPFALFVLIFGEMYSRRARTSVDGIEDKDD